jgi:VanZ family protein
MLSALRNPKFWYGMVLVWFVTLFFLSSLPKLPPGPKIPFEDKVAHLVFYSIGATWFYLARRFRLPPVTGRAAMWSAVLFCALIGVTDEFHQSFVPNRSGNDPWDWLADTLGGFLGSLFGWISWRLIRPADPHLSGAAPQAPNPPGM